MMWRVRPLILLGTFLLLGCGGENEPKGRPPGFTEKPKGSRVGIEKPWNGPNKPLGKAQ